MNECFRFIANATPVQISAWLKSHTDRKPPDSLKGSVDDTTRNNIDNGLVAIRLEESQRLPTVKEINDIGTQLYFDDVIVSVKDTPFVLTTSEGRILQPSNESPHYRFVLRGIIIHEIHQEDNVDFMQGFTEELIRIELRDVGRSRTQVVGESADVSSLVQYMEQLEKEILEVFSVTSEEFEPEHKQHLEESQVPETKSIHPKWWPKNESTKIRWKWYYRKIKPMADKGDTYSAISNQIGISRQLVSRILRWANRDSFAHK